MLDLLRLPPDTPVYGLKRPAAETAAPAEPVSAPAQGPSIQRKPLDEALADADHSDSDDTVQRAGTVGEQSVEAGKEESGKEEPGKSDDPDIDDLARKVYRILKDRLRVERERSAR